MPIASASLANPAVGFVFDEEARNLVRLLSSGGDARITLDPKTGLNRYLSAPYPRDVVAYASSTANDISEEAFAFLRNQGVPQDYAAALEELRGRIRTAYGINDDVGVVFAPSGTDLEYVALYLAGGQSDVGVHNILLGADEVGSGCIYSAHGRFFAAETALGVNVQPADRVAGLGDVSLTDIPLRCGQGDVRTSEEICETINIEMGVAAMDGRKSLLHVVHGSKTGLILPSLDDLDRLCAEYQDRLSLVVDACQARITGDAVRDYLARDAIVFLTGSKFMGGPPFNGFALVPPSLMNDANALPSGFTKVFRRAEWPAGWPGSQNLDDSGNAGLALRLSASIFELERFQALPTDKVREIIERFRYCVLREIIEPMDLAMVESAAFGDLSELIDHPIEMQSLITVDVSSLPNMRNFDAAQRVHKAMAAKGLRLGQSVKSVRVEGEWAGTLRIGLSMPQITRWAQLSSEEYELVLTQGMRQVADTLKAYAKV